MTFVFDPKRYEGRTKEQWEESGDYVKVVVPTSDGGQMHIAICQMNNVLLAHPANRAVIADAPSLLAHAVELTAEVGRLRARVDELEATVSRRDYEAEMMTAKWLTLDTDATRYRWLRSRDPGLAGDAVPPGLFIGKVPENLILTGEDADSAIDAARAALSGDAV